MPVERRSLLSSAARIQVPYIKILLGDKNNGFTFGVFTKSTLTTGKSRNQLYTEYGIQYPNYVQRLVVTKINGQINQYTLTITYPVTQNDDPNFFEKIFSSISDTRKITFTYGDATMPSYVYKNEEAIITDIKQSFSFGNSGIMQSVITYTISAVSSAVVAKSSTFSFNKSGLAKPSDEIKAVFKNKNYGLRDFFTGMSADNLDTLIAGDDKYVEIKPKTNISPLDYITYLVSCMVPAGSIGNTVNNDVYILSLYDDTVYDKAYNNNTLGGPYFRVSKVSTNVEHSDAYEIDIGINSRTIVRNFSIDNQETYSLYYDYNQKINDEKYVRRLNNNGEWEEIYSPMFTSRNDTYRTRPEDTTWFTKVTKYPISANITVQGLLRPAQLMQYVRLNILFPGGHKHIHSGLYIITKQQDTIDASGYSTQLELTRIAN